MISLPGQLAKPLLGRLIADAGGRVRFANHDGKLPVLERATYLGVIWIVLTITGLTETSEVQERNSSHGFSHESSRSESLVAIELIETSQASD